MFPKNYIPTKPFPNFKWVWACRTCTEGINDPVVLLGVLSRMRKLELQNKRLKYSSEEFARELTELSNDISDSIKVDLERRTGERNLIRNSGQYWKGVGLIPVERTGGVITLTEFGRKVADHDISQTEFAAITVQTFKLPNAGVLERSECQEWLNHRIVIYPLRLILSIGCALADLNQGFITAEELIKIVIPLSGCNAELQDYVNFILWYRAKEISLIGWPECYPSANDKRMAREYLLFLSNYGYLNLIREDGQTNYTEQYYLNTEIIEEIKEIIQTAPKDESLMHALDGIRASEVTSEFERKRIRTRAVRPNQQNFRREVLNACERCVITNVTMPEILEAAHIKPFKYNGEDTVANGFAMRVDIHTLFDAGHLRISADGIIDLSPKARMDYGASIPPRIVIPEFTNREFLRWRWENYNGF